MRWAFTAVALWLALSFIVAPQTTATMLGDAVYAFKRAAQW